MGEGTAEQPSRRGQRVRRIVIDLSIMTVIGVLLALVGPFGSFDAPLSLRLVSWLSLTWIGYAIYSPMGFVVDRLHRSLDLPVLPLWVAAALLATVPMAGLVWIIGRLPGPIAAPSPELALQHYLNVLVIGGAITALMFTLARSSATRAAPAFDDPERAPDPVGAGAEPLPTPAAEPAAPFLARLSPSVGDRLLALEMEDHYVRAHTDAGSELILMRMRDAVAELEGIEGLQVHRSWWVARDAVEGSGRDGRNVRLRIAGGLEAPVSRANVQLLKDEGWIAR